MNENNQLNLNKEYILNNVFASLISPVMQPDIAAAGLVDPVPGMDDLRVIYRVNISDQMNIPEHTSTLIMDHRLMLSMGISKKELKEASAYNIAGDYQATFTPLHEILWEMRSDLPRDLIPETPFWVLSNRCQLFGAAAILQPDVPKQIYDMLGENFVILPSSVHDLIICPESAVHGEYGMLQDMVKSVNETLNKRDILSDHIYRFDAEQEKFITIGGNEQDQGEDIER